MNTGSGEGHGEGGGAARVLLVGPLRRPKGVRDEAQVPVGAATTVSDVLEALGYGPTERRVLRVMRGTASLRLDERVAPGDELTVFLPVGGG